MVLWQGHVVSMIVFVKASDANGSIFDRFYESVEFRTE